VLQYLRVGKIDEALGVADEAIKANPRNPLVKPIENFRRESELVKRFAKDPLFGPLIVVMLQAPTESDIAIEALRIIRTALDKQDRVDNVITQLRPLADRAGRAVSLQNLLIQLYKSRARFGEAAVIAQRTMKMSPNSVEMARQAAECLALQGEFLQAMSPAATWRELTAAQPMAADVFIANLHYRLGDHNSVTKTLEPYLAPAMRKPEGPNRDVIVLQVRSHLARGAIKPAEDMLLPLASKAPEWRTLWIELGVVSIEKPAAAADWLERAGKILPEDDIDNRIALANAWYQLGNKVKEPKFKATAVALIGTLATKAPDKIGVVYARGVLEAQEGRFDEAAKSYRRVLELDPKNVLARNNLAMMLTDHGGDLAEAAKLAAAAVEAAPGVATLHDTLAHVRLKQKDYKAAAQSLINATKLEPETLQWRLSLAQVYDEANQTADLGKVLEQIDALVPDKAKLPSDTQAILLKLKAKAAGRAGANP
jgi:tetratricopeptide (TPR) repeat protein